MKNKLLKVMGIILVLAVSVSAFSGCESKEAEKANDEAAAAAAQASVVTTPFVTLVADGHEITVENTAGKTVQQLLDQARIVLNDTDLLVVSPDQLLDGTLTIRVLRQTGEPTVLKPTEPELTESETTEPETTESESTEPAPTEGERTIVSVEVYEDCDGSGHGVKIIKYSDGTQEEVYF